MPYFRGQMWVLIKLIACLLFLKAEYSSAWNESYLLQPVTGYHQCEPSFSLLLTYKYMYSFQFSFQSVMYPASLIIVIFLAKNAWGTPQLYYS